MLATSPVHTRHTVAAHNRSEWKLLCLMLFINVLQSSFTTLLNDEPYYWVYSRYPAAGYFDHPPLIGWLIKFSTLLFPAELGVRLLVMLLGTGTFFLLYKMIRQEAGPQFRPQWLALLLGSSLFLNIYSFLAVPDTPLLFFSVLFLYMYRRYLAHDTWPIALALGLISALLLYAKYHGLLLIVFTLLSNPKLLSRRSFYGIAAITTVLLLPHAYWQVQHHFASLKFHLLNRETDFRWKHIFSYIGEQLAVTGPVMLLVFSLLYRPKNLFQRALKFNVIGIFVFFLFSAIKKNVNVHWTGIAFPSMLCLSYLYIINLRKNTGWVKGLLIINLFVVVFLRLDFAFNWVRIPHFNELNPKVLLTELQQKAGGRPLVFENVYNEPSFYMFYQHKPSYAVNTIAYKKTQYNYLPLLEQQFQGKAVCLVTKHPVNRQSILISIPKGRSYMVTLIDCFASFTDVNITAPDFKTLHAGKTQKLALQIDSHLSAADQQLFERLHGYLALTLTCRATHQPFTYKYVKPVNLARSSKALFEFTAPVLKGEYTAVFSVMTDSSLAPVFNSDIYEMVVK